MGQGVHDGKCNNCVVMKGGVISSYSDPDLGNDIYRIYYVVLLKEIKDDTSNNPNAKLGKLCTSTESLVPRNGSRCNRTFLNFHNECTCSYYR